MIALLVLGVGLGRLQTIARNQGRADFVGRIIQTAVTPLARPIASGMDGTSEFFYGLFRARTLERQNASLKMRLGGLALYEQQIDDLNAQVDQLRRLNSLGPLPGKERITAEVIGFAPYESRITIGVGEERGIKPNMPVINGDGIVGIVQTVGRGSCQAVLLSHPDRQIGGIDLSRKPPPFGLVKGRDAGTLVLTLFDPKAPIQSGDVIVTSGLSDRIPKGLIIGRVIDVVDDADFGTRRATIDPVVNIGALREVQILR